MIELSLSKPKLQQIEEYLLFNSKDDATIIDKKNAQDFFDKLLKYVPYALGINNNFFINFLNPLNPPPGKEAIHIAMQNWLEQKRILRRSLVQGLEATVVSEYWSGQMAYLDLLTDEIDGCHVNMAWESLKQPARVAGFDLPHSVDSQNSPEIVKEMKELRAWQAETLRKNLQILVAVAIFERQSQPVLRRTYQALNSWYGSDLDVQQRASFERYFEEHTSIRDITSKSTFEDIIFNIPVNKGVEEKHAVLTSTCFVEASKTITLGDLRESYKTFNTVNQKQMLAWEAVYNKCMAVAS